MPVGVGHFGPTMTRQPLLRGAFHSKRAAQTLIGPNALKTNLEVAQTCLQGLPSIVKGILVSLLAMIKLLSGV